MRQFVDPISQYFEITRVYMSLQISYYVTICLLRHIMFCSCLRWDWVFLERTQIFNDVLFTRHFIEFIVVQTKRFVGSNVNEILT